jgi:uncharacterized protein
MNAERNSPHFETPPLGLHVVAKPVGPACNLDCEYCFYLEKQALFAAHERSRMSDDVLQAFITGYISSQPTPVVEFVWQGGEPTLLGLEFFRRVIELQKPYLRQKTIKNSLQTNGTLLNDAWCRFLKSHDFMVGISMDGPKEIHDRYRRDRKGGGTFDEVLRGLRLLQKHQVEYNVLAAVARETAARPLEVYRFFKDAGVEFIQFTPIIERLAGEDEARLGLRLAAPAALDRADETAAVAPWSVPPEAYGDFLNAVFDEWVRHDVGRTFVMNFEWALCAWGGIPAGVCVHAPECGRSLVIEHNGDVFACDHFVYPRYRLGNIMTETLPAMVAASLRSGFGLAKASALPDCCRECDVLAACRGGCPKHRFTGTLRDEPGLNYLCEGYRKFFRHSRKYLRGIVQLLALDLPPEYVMRAIGQPLVIPASEKTGQKEIVLWIK